MTARGRPERRWVVREGDGRTVAEILARVGEGETAVKDGRVFVGRTRVRSAAQPVRVGDELRIGAAASAGEVASARAGGPAAAVIWLRDGMIACDKPAGIPTVPDRGGASHALVALAAAAAGRKPEEMRVTSRLDREVSGVVVFATSADAEARLRRAREEGRYARRYVAIAGGARSGVDEPARTVTGAVTVARWDAPIGAGRDPLHRAAFGAEARAASTRWAVVARAGGFALLAVEPETGRTHQIRVHASHAGMPLLGDRDYGGAARVTLANGRVIALSRIALHAARVTVPDERGAPLVASAPIPAELARAWSDLGGDAEAWDRAVSCELEI